MHERNRVQFLVLDEFFRSAPHPAYIFSRLGVGGRRIDLLIYFLAQLKPDLLWRVVRGLPPERREMLRKRLDRKARNIKLSASRVSGDPAGKDEVPVPAGTPSNRNGQ